jgi:hypothetical protein
VYIYIVCVCVCGGEVEKVLFEVFIPRTHVCV